MKKLLLIILLIASANVKSSDLKIPCTTQNDCGPGYHCPEAADDSIEKNDYFCIPNEGEPETEINSIDEADMLGERG